MRTEIIKRTISTVDDLPEAERRKEIEDHREMEVNDSFWYESIVDDWIEENTARGVTMERGNVFFDIYAKAAGCRNAYVEPAEYMRSLTGEHHAKFRPLLAHSDLVAGHRTEVNIYMRHYDIEVEEPDELNDAPVVTLLKEVNGMAWEDLQQLGEELGDHIAATFSESARNFLKAVEEQYEYLTSDEYILEWLRNNKEYTIKEERFDTTEVQHERRLKETSARGGEQIREGKEQLGREPAASQSAEVRLEVARTQD